MSKTYKFKLKLKEKIEVTEKLYILRFKYPIEINFRFKAGQFVSVVVAENTKRFYSIASPPYIKDYLEFLITTTPGGPGSKFFDKIKVGDTVNFEGPYGKFTFQSKHESMFVATGTGIAPIISMIREQIEHKKNKNQIQLIYGVRFEQQLAYRDIIEKLYKKSPNFYPKLTLTYPTYVWEGKKGRVTHWLEKTILPSTFDYYLCGNKNMVKDAREILIKQKDVKLDKIHFELY